ncbi:MAG TPA: serine hydrolase domain-containing protein, partial [Phototrophicaceae bacterium]|nr:serine hydrolase domain-containing protein [Phototrophicaceae bacterium]
MKSKLLDMQFNFKLLALLFVMTLLTTSLLTTSAAVTGSSPHSPFTGYKGNASLVNDKSESSAIPNSVKQFILNQIVGKSNASIVVGFVDPNGTKVFGYGNISKTNNVPVNGNTLFNIASLTKPFTTLALADMVKQGIMNLDDPIEKYLPYNVTVPQYNGHKITLGDLATHTSGLPFMPSNIWLNDTVGDLNPNYNSTQMYQALSNTTLLSQPGTKFLYSDFGLGLLGHILSLNERGMPYEQLVKNRVLDVLGMNDTKITLSENDIKNRFPVGHLNGSEIETPEVPEVIAGAGAYRSTANDLLKYLSANLGLIHTTLDEPMQLQHLIQHPSVSANPMNYSEY